MPLFCRHNRMVADCPICSKGTVLDPDRGSGRRPRRTAEPGAKRASGQRGRGAAATRVARGPYALAGPYDGREVRLERVPGGLRLASWRGGSLERTAPLIATADLPKLVEAAADQGLFGPTEAERVQAALVAAVSAIAEPAAPGAEQAAPAGERATPNPAPFGRSPGTSGELRDELRVEPLHDGQLRLARWVMRPGRGWELQEAPVLLPAARFAEAIADAAGRGAIDAGQPDP